MRLTMTLLILAFSSATALADQQTAIASALKDIQSTPAGIRPFVRYLSLYNIPVRDREEAYRVMAFHLNSLSREAEMTLPTMLADGETLRIVVSDYSWSPQTWEELVKDDPYFHALAEVEIPVGIRDGAGTWKQTGTKKERRQALAPWLADTPEQAKALALLSAETHSTGPVLRADWFFNRTALQRDKGVGYYDFLGVGKTEADFDKLVGFRLDLAKQFKDEKYAVVLRSTVALNNRRLERYGKIGGAKWLSRDVKDNTEKRNFARVLDDGFEFDATEQIASLPNGLHAYFLADNKGKRFNSAPDNIASDGLASGTDRRIHAGISCIRCHGLNSGINTIRDHVRSLAQPPLVLQSPDYEKLKRLRQLYLSDLESTVKKDRELYAEAVKKVNKLEPAENARLYARFWDEYAEKPFTLDRIALEVGKPKEKVLEALDAYLKRTGSLDPILAGLLQTPTIPIRSEQWEEVFVLMQLALRGGIQP